MKKALLPSPPQAEFRGEEGGGEVQLREVPQSRAAQLPGARREGGAGSDRGGGDVPRQQEERKREEKVSEEQKRKLSLMSKTCVLVIQGIYHL